MIFSQFVTLYMVRYNFPMKENYFKSMGSVNAWITTPSSLLLIVFTLVGLLIVKYYYDRRRLFALGNKLPGPKPWPLIGNVTHFKANKTTGDFLGIVNSLTAKYGFARFWFGHQLHVFVCTPEDAKTFYSSPDLLDRSDFAQMLLRPMFGNGLLTVNGDEWREKKQLLEPLMTHKFLKKPTSVYDQKTDTFIRILENKIGSTISIYQEVARCIFDIASAIFTGVSLDLQETDAAVQNDLEIGAKYATQRLLIPWQHFEFLFKLSKNGKNFYQAHKNVDNYIKYYEEIYEPHYKQDGLIVIDNDENFALKTLIYSIYKKSHDNLLDYLAATVVTARDTTGSTISFALMMLGKHPDMQQKLFDEISPVAEKGFDDNELQKLSYLDRIIKETLRLFTPAPVSSRKATEDVLFGEDLVPKGASVLINLFAIHHDPDQYENPNSFDPDHFLPENVAKRHPYAFIPFGMGKRKCVGGKFAYILMRLILAKVVYNYRIECDWGVEDIQLRFFIATKARHLYYPIRLFKR